MSAEDGASDISLSIYSFRDDESARKGKCEKIIIKKRIDDKHR